MTRSVRAAIYFLAEAEYHPVSFERGDRIEKRVLEVEKLKYSKIHYHQIKNCS